MFQLYYFLKIFSLPGSTCPGKMAPFFHPGLWPLAATVSAAPTSAGGGLAPHGGGGLLGTGASAAATARSTGCIVSALAAADPDRPFLLHPAMSNANLSAASRYVNESYLRFPTDRTIGSSTEKELNQQATKQIEITWHFQRM